VFFIAIFTAWIAPCTVWVNSLTTKSYFLLITSITGVCLHSLNIASIYWYLSFNNLSANAEPPITHCFEDADNSSFVQFWSSDSNNSSLAILGICKNVYCLPKIRLCSANETPTDLFYNKVGPIGFLLLLIGLCSASCLQIIGNYYDLFQWSKNILHLSLLHDFLRNSDVLSDEIVDEIKQMVWKELRSDRGIVNRKDQVLISTTFYEHRSKKVQKRQSRHQSVSFLCFWDLQR
jgi:hypothetical protein